MLGPVSSKLPSEKEEGVRLINIIVVCCCVMTNLASLPLGCWSRAYSG